MAEKRGVQSKLVGAREAGLSADFNQRLAFVPPHSLTPITVSDLTLEDFKSIHSAFEADVKDVSQCCHVFCRVVYKLVPPSLVFKPTPTFPSLTTKAVELSEQRRSVQRLRWHRHQICQGAGCKPQQMDGLPAGAFVIVVQ